MICVNCNEKWELLDSKNRNVKFCPFCGKEIIQIDKDSVVDVPSFLRYIIYVDGDKSLKDLQKIVSLFSDFLPNLIVEKRILRIVLESGVYEKICASRESITEQELSKYISYLEDDFGLSKKWVHTAVDWILIALNYSVNSTKIENVQQKGNDSKKTKTTTEPNDNDDIVTDYGIFAQEGFDFNKIPQNAIKHYDSSWIMLTDGTLIVTKDIYRLDDKSVLWKNAKRIIISKNITKTQTREFYSLTNVVEVILPVTLTEIGFQCFSECVKLKTVIIQSKIERIKGKAFENCRNLSDITIPDSIKYIGDNAFYNCKIHDIIVPKNCSLCSGNTGIVQ